MVHGMLGLHKGGLLNGSHSAWGTQCRGLRGFAQSGLWCVGLAMHGGCNAWGLQCMRVVLCEIFIVWELWHVRVVACGRCGV